MSLGDLIMSAMGGGNPLQAQPGSPPPAPGGPPPAAGPTGAPAAGPQTQPQPQAYQSPPDLQAMYLKLYQQDRAANEFDRGLATMLGGFKGPPGGAQTMMNSVPPAQDPGILMNNIMQLQQYSQQQQRYQAFVNSKDVAAKQLGITPDEVLAMGPDAVKTAMAVNIQPEQLRVYNAFGTQFAAQHQFDKDPTTGQPIGLEGARKLFEQQNPMSNALAGATGTVDPQRVQMQADLADWQRNNAATGKPAPFNDVNSWQLWKARTKQESDNRIQAAGQFHDLDANLGNYVNNLSAVANDPKLADAKAGGILGGGLTGQFVGNVLPATSSAYPLYTRINGLQDQTKNLANQGGSLTKGSLLGLASGAPDFTKFALPESDYRSSVLQPAMRAALTAQAANYGASGRTDEAPGYLKPYMDPIYQPGGDLYVKSPSPRATKTPEPGTTPLTPKDVQDFKEMMETFGPQKALDIFRGEKKDVSSLE
jgi:hypothetical protein